MTKRKMFGEEAIRKGYLNPEQLSHALSEQERVNKEEKRSTINAIVIQDWSNDKYIYTILQYLLKAVKKEGVKRIEGDVYDKDNTTHQQILALKKLGFKVESGGSLTGYAQYFVTKKV